MENSHDLAPNLKDFIGNGERFRDQSERGNYNYLLKCTDGIFSGKFLFINTTPDGELFGSGDPDKIDLQLKHQSVKLYNQLQPCILSQLIYQKSMQKDCGSESGTWVRVKEIDLYQQSRNRVFKVKDYHFSIEEGSEYFDEVGNWLRRYSFFKYNDLCRQKGILQLKELSQKLTRAEIKKIESESDEVDRFFSLVDDLDSDDIIQNQTQRKKLLILKFLKGPIIQGVQPREIPLKGDQPLVFGCKESKDVRFVMTGERVVDRHFEICFDNNTLVMRTLNFNCWESCGVYKRLFDQESHILRPGHAFRIGTLEFLVERYNTGIVSDIGQRVNMEDTYQIVQDMLIDEETSVTYYAVFDGHGGPDSKSNKLMNKFFLFTKYFLQSFGNIFIFLNQYQLYIFLQFKISQIYKKYPIQVCNFKQILLILFRVQKIKFAQIFSKNLSQVIIQFLFLYYIHNSKVFFYFFLIKKIISYTQVIHQINYLIKYNNKISIKTRNQKQKLMILDLLQHFQTNTLILLCLNNHLFYLKRTIFTYNFDFNCATYLRENLHHELKKQFLDNIDGIKESDDLNESLINCVNRAFEETDMKFKQLYPAIANQCGSTAVVCVILGNKLVCANVGDARAVLCRNGKAIDLSVDHKASREDEQQRIKKQGGYIVFGRVLGRLAVTRAFGDFDCKNIEVPNDDQEKEIKSFVLNEPEIRVINIDPVKDHFILLASDGLFDRFSSQECINIAREKLSQMPVMEQDPQKVARELVNEAIYKRLITDNITVILATLNRGIDSSLVGLANSNSSFQ